MTDAALAPSDLDPRLFDTTSWPVVFAHFPELGEPDRVERLLSGVTRVLAQETPFVMVWIPPTHDHDDEPHADEKAATVWLKAHRARLNAHCRGYLYLVRDEKLAAELDGRIRTVARMYAFPLRLVPSREAALAAAAPLLRSAPSA
ncbi:hypothetical protein [Xanthobacter sp. ZOL 2024]